MLSNQKLLYVDLLKRTLIDLNSANSFEYLPINEIQRTKTSFFLEPLNRLLKFANFVICKQRLVNENNRINGADWPANAFTMIGLKRLNNIEFCINSILDDNIEGDLIETGVWRGGATIFMQAMLKLNGVENKKVWVADSFRGLPKPDIKNFSQDKGLNLYKIKLLNVSLEKVKQNFEKYNLLDENVIFLKGWFKDTLPNAPIEKLSLLRLDGDLYESTIQSLQYLYPKLSVGGYVIIDDYNSIVNCKQAVIDYRSNNQINEKIIEIDAEGVYWRKEK